MSNKQRQDHKAIQIRTIERIKQQFQPEEIPPEETLLTTEQKIEQAKINLKNLNEKQDKLLQSTKDKINQEQEHWEEEKQKLIEEAKKFGYYKGFEQGKNDSLKKYTNLVEEANELTKIATKDYYETIDQSKKTIIKLAIHTAEKILNQHLTNEPEEFLSIVNAALKTMKNTKMIAIYVHPNQYHFLQKQKEELMNSLDGDAQLEIYIEQDLQENNCLIKHSFGQVDASIDTQLEQIQAVLQNVSGGE